MQSLNQNQFSPIPVQGQLDLRFNPQTFAVEIDSSQATPMVAGQPFTIVDSSGGVPKVVAAALDSDDIAGFLCFDLKHQSFKAGDQAEASMLEGNVMYMTASAAIARNAEVMIVVSGTKVATATTGKMIVGRAFDKAGADGDLIRVAIVLPGKLA